MIRLPSLLLLFSLSASLCALADREGEDRRGRDVPREGDVNHSDGKKDKTLRVTVSEGGVVIGDRKIPHKKLREVLSRTDAKAAFLVAAEDVKFKTVRGVMDALRNNGIRDIRLAVDKDQAEGDRPRGNGDAPREGDQPRRDGDAPREGDRPPSDRRLDERELAKLKRIYTAWDKNGDGGVTFDEWVSMKEGTLTPERRSREKRWFERADSNEDRKVTEKEWIAWKSNPGRE